MRINYLLRFAAVFALSATCALGSFAARSDNSSELCLGGPDIPHDQSIDACTELLESCGTSKSCLFDAHLWRGIHYLGKGHYDAAQREFDSAVAIRSDVAFVFLKRGAAFYYREEYTLAIADFSRAIALSPTDLDLQMDATLSRGLAHARIGSDQHAIADFDAVVRAPMTYFSRHYSPKPAFIAEALVAKGWVLVHQGQLEDAIKAFGLAIKLNPRNDMAFSNRGWVFHKKAAYDLAIADLEQALRLAPQSKLARERLRIVRDARETILARVQANGSTARIALVIGNSGYQNSNPLPNALKDAGDVAAALSRLGYQIFGYPKTNFSMQALQAELTRFRLASFEASHAIVWYSGHGQQMREDGSEIPLDWVIPVDAKIQSAQDVSSNAISVETISNAVLAAKSLRLVVIDACRNTNFYTGLRGMTRNVTTYNGVFVVYSAQPGHVALDGPEGENSPFARAFLERIGGRTEIDVRQLIGDVVGRTASLTKGAQRPQPIDGLGTGDVVLIAP